MVIRFGFGPFFLKPKIIFHNPVFPDRHDQTCCILSGSIITYARLAIRHLRVFRYWIRGFPSKYTIVVHIWSACARCVRSLLTCITDLQLLRDLIVTMTSSKTFKLKIIRWQGSDDKSIFNSVVLVLLTYMSGHKWGSVTVLHRKSIAHGANVIQRRRSINITWKSPLRVYNLIFGFHCCFDGL